MASYAYPPWSAPASLQRKDKKSKWDKTKQAILRPWMRRSQRKEKRKPTASPSKEPPIELRYNQQNPFAPRGNLISGGIPMFSNPNSPFGNYSPGNHRQQSQSPPPKAQQSKEAFDPDALVGRTNRPSLANVFPMYDSPKIVTKPGQVARPQILVTPVSPPRTPSSIDRRHSVPSSPPPNLETPLRPTRVSESSLSTERSRRRERRAEGLRRLPQLPNAYMYNSPYRPLNGPFVPRGLQSSFSFPPWPQPHEQLQELEEELEEEEVEGLEEIYEEPDSEPVRESIQRRFLEPSTAEKVNSKTKKKNKSQEANQTGEDIKGFDGFMMY